MTEDRSQPDDATLLRAHVDGDPDAFADLVQRHRDRLWALALRTTGDADDAADALQEALISAFRRADGFRGEAQVTTWLHRIVVNACLDQLRRRRAKATEALPEDEDRAAILSSSATIESDPAEASEQRADVIAALAQLSADQRAALVLVDMQGYSVQEAAELLGCAAGTVKSRCSRGRGRLVPLLAQYRRNQQAPADVEPVTSPTAFPTESTARDPGATHDTGGGTQ
ncbi:MAG: RNA polymerase sigma factor SigM [Nocardioidaceae bacterium]